MHIVEGQQYYTVEDVARLAGGTERNARDHCNAVADERPEWSHSYHCPHRMTQEQFYEVLRRISRVGRCTRGKAKEKPLVTSVPSLF